MTNEPNGSQNYGSTCLNEEDFYNFIAQPAGGLRTAEYQSHLAACMDCREELAGLLRVLRPEPDAVPEAIPQPSANEIEQTLKLIQKATQRERLTKTHIRRWHPWAAAAAAAIAMSLTALGLSLWKERQKSNAFYAQARAVLEEVYDSKSPSGLRLNLPFQSSASRRNSPSDETLNSAENYLLQALAVRNGMSEARLGLGYIYLSKGQFTKARERFQEILDQQDGNIQAMLGRGVTSYEEGVASKNPIDRSASMIHALADFDRILKQNPVSGEARYNKVLTLYEVGRHKEALEEIAGYLSLDSRSLWAEKLKDLESQIRMTRSEAVEREVHRAALARDAGALQTLARLVPYQMPAALRTSLQQSLAAEGIAGSPDGSALRWASEIIESSHSAATGDHSGAQLLEFYGGLSPPQRQAKKSLDARLKRLIDLHRQDGKLQAVIQESQPLIQEFESLNDHWQLVDLHHLRGTCFYYQSADFDTALREYQKMHRNAERSGSPDLIARALATLVPLYGEKRQFDEALACLTKLRSLAETYQMDAWLAFAFRYFGGLHLNLNQFEHSLNYYSSALALSYRLMHETNVVVSLENLGVVLEKMDRPSEAVSFYREAALWQEKLARDGRTAAASALTARRLNLSYKQGNLALRMNDLAAAETFFQKSLESYKNGMKELEARSRLGLAQVHFGQKRLERTADELQRIQALSAAGEFPEIAWQTQTLLGSVRKEKGDTAAALAHFEQAIHILEEICKNISSRDSKQSFLNRRFDPYREMVSLSYHSQEDKQTTLDLVDRAKSSVLQAYLEPSQERLGITSRPNPKAGIARWPGVTAHNISIVEYFLASGELFVFISGPSRLEAVTLRITHSGLERQVQDYLESIKKNDRASFETQSRRLYDQLLEPSLSTLDRKTEMLVILPDGPLHLLPFSGLKDREGRYLVEKYAIAYAPSRRVFEYCLSLDKQNATGSDRSLLLLDGSSNLAGASEELAYLARLYAEKTNLIGSRDIGSLRRQAGEFDLIHFSGHATMANGKPSLVFSSGTTPGYLDASTIGNWNLRKNRLVILAGCNTGVGPSTEGVGSWGLLPAFLNAGAPALMVSLLPVDDRATRNLTSRFYELLVRGSIPKARALQQAQISLLKDSRAEVNAPLSWIPFVLVGDPR